MITYFISGHADITNKEFMTYYMPAIMQAVKDGAHFVVGDCDGVDALSQILLNKIIPLEEQSRVKVFYKGENPQNYMSKGFMAVGGFRDHLEAAVAMTLCSEDDIAYIYSGRQNSITARNLLRRKTIGFDYLSYINDPKGHVDFWEMFKEQN